ncbi:hypothetical protein RHMOL_Rhmol03G0288800 [Rhododendron molle]|uniref:Uncharacterized protein n=1 Tax=Rhododendron molle TaxID=49168 RepID=A0ACC0PL82_RHOML|nr:hypothetical protein RHMOL_Rhmol03G0288800 [Rhododendron molle]
MRAGLSTIQQTLTPEAASVLSLSIAEAGRRSHGQTTPLHVAATLLSSPSGFLRQACIRSHPNSSHPLQCRALELCFSVALERLPTTTTAQTTAASDPPVSNALLAALKRAQAHQRRGCPEQQQQPLLAVKVELEQLIISILDDPSVSRVMREASFSSPAVKAAIEQSLNATHSNSVNQTPIGIGFQPNPISNRNLYLNPRLKEGNFSNSVQSGGNRNEEVKRVMDILLRDVKKNPVLVGESEPEVVVREVIKRVEKGELGDGPLRNVQVIPIGKELCLDKSLIPNKVKDLGGIIEAAIGNSCCGGVVLDLGDLKWLVEGSGGLPEKVLPETGRAAVEALAELLSRFGEGSGGGGRVWLIGTATCETYLRCQVYHPSMENDWDLQAVPITSRSPFPGMFPRLGASPVFGNSVESRIPLKSFPSTTTDLLNHVRENLDPTGRIGCCPQCTQNYERELAKLVAKEYENSSSEAKSDAPQPPLPPWMQNAKGLNIDIRTPNLSQPKDQEAIFKQKTHELGKKWSDTCLHLHPNFHQNLGSERNTLTTGLYNPKLFVRQPLLPKLQQTRNLGETLQLNSNPVAKQPSNRMSTPPGSPVGTDLALGQTKILQTTPERNHKDCAKDLLGPKLLPKVDEFQVEKFANVSDADSFKKLLKGLTEKVWWQREAASEVATAVTRCKLGSGSRRVGGSKGDIWLLFTGPDRIGKKKMASVLSDQFCGTNPVMISLGPRRDDEDSDVSFRGKTALDRIAEAVRRNPFSVIMLDDIDEADLLVRGGIKRAMERGRISDSYGREISLGNVIFILTAKWLPENLRSFDGQKVLHENKFSSIASHGWQLRLSIVEKGTKRRANWLHNTDRPTKKEMGCGLSFDLNLAADSVDDRTDGSDLTIDHEDDYGLENWRFSINSLPHEMISLIDNAIVFKPVELGLFQCEVKRRIAEKFSAVLDDRLSLELEEEALEKILVGVWLGRTGLEEWAEKVLVPSFQQLKASLPFTAAQMVVWLESDSNSGSRSTGDWLPSTVTVKVDGV